MEKSGPRLVLFHGKKRKPLHTLYDVFQGQKHQTRVSREFGNKLVLASQGEWLLVKDEDVKDKFSYCIMNGVTGHKFELPPIHNEYHEFGSRSCFLLSGSPDADVACTVYLMIYQYVLYCKIGATEFSIQELREGSDSIWIGGATIFQGRLYIIANADCLYCAQLEDGDLQLERCIDEESFWDQRLFIGDFCKLVGSCDDKLLCIVGCRLGFDDWVYEVFEADLCGKVWKKVNNVGGVGAIFMDGYRAFYAPVQPECGFQADCIYYVRSSFDNSDDVAVFSYDLRKQRRTLLPPSPFKIKGRKSPKLPYELRWIS